MPEIVKPDIKVNIRIEPKTCRHYYNDQLVVVHCHHYATLYTQLAMDAEQADLLQDVSEEMFFKVLSDYFKENETPNFFDRLTIGCQLFGLMGLGSVTFRYAGENSADLILTRSHVDKGWIRKWGKSDQPVNFIGAGAIAGMLACIFNKPAGTYLVRETKSLAMGEDYSEMKAVKR